MTENIYGHKKRLEWVLSHCTREDRIIELGCGTGVMITLPLASAGFDIVGLDIHTPSIDFGRDLCKRQGLGEERLLALDLKDLRGKWDVIIASEMLEHLNNEHLPSTLALIKDAMKPKGKLLVTVPNGYGWFEAESWLWYKARLGKLLQYKGLDSLIDESKARLFGRLPAEAYLPSTLADSPHMQRFTYKSIQATLRRYGFEVLSITGSVLVAGPFSNLFFTGVSPAMTLNGTLGDRFPRIASGYFLACRLSE